MIHHLGPEPANLHGWFDPALPPLLRIAPGDTVVYRTPDAGWDQWPPGTAYDSPRPGRPEGAGHALVGPVAVAGAEPGDTLVVHIREVVARDWGWGVHRPGLAPLAGILAGEPDDCAAPYLQHIHLDRASGLWQFSEEIAILAAPFMGIFGVAPAQAGRTPTHVPGPYGGNMDCKELVAGATLYLPVFRPGALFSVGDGHGAQGDGEVDGAAIETGMDRLVLEFGLVKAAAPRLPRAETPTHLLFLAFDEDLDRAVVAAGRDVIAFLKATRGLSHDQAYNLISLAVDFRITQVVDGLKGVHAMLPKSIFLTDPPTFAVAGAS
jgi:acetamidase/formamidase